MSKRFALISSHTLLPTLLGRRLCEWKLAKSVVIWRSPDEFRPGVADVLLIDIEAVQGKIDELLTPLAKRAGQARLVILTECRGGYLAHLAYKLGVRAILHRGDSFDDFRDGLRIVIAGGMFISPLIDQERRSLFARILSEREIAVMKGLALGKTNAELASGLGISAETVRTHRRNCMQKVGVRTQLELAQFAMSQGVVSWPRQSASLRI
ncbi:response regulator transcription factor [Oleiharenicola lentus]|uniref:helix-turn-helix transcriptional regulator n=1 Tax=Oleiharenicola lentus TaxID=2508720 RepID=UPI003F6804B3